MLLNCGVGEVRDTVELRGASRDFTGTGAIEDVPIKLDLLQEVGSRFDLPAIVYQPLI